MKTMTSQDTKWTPEPGRMQTGIVSIHASELAALRAQVAELRGHHTETEAILAAELVAQKAKVSELAAALQRADDLIGRTIFDCDPPVNFTAEAQDVIRAALAKGAA